VMINTVGVMMAIEYCFGSTVELLMGNDGNRVTPLDVLLILIDGRFISSTMVNQWVQRHRTWNLREV